MSLEQHEAAAIERAWFIELCTMTDQEIRLICGEMSKQEMRTVKAVLAYLRRRVEKGS